MISRFNRKSESATIALNALCITLVFLGTRVLQFPIPLGYAHLGNALILLVAVYYGPKTGAIAGGLGSALADLTSYPAWTLPTLVIKSLMGLLCALIAGAPKERGPRWRQPRVLLACLTATAEMIFGYFATGSALYGSVATGALQIPGLTAEGIVGIVLFYAIGVALERARVSSYAG